MMMMMMMMMIYRQLLCDALGDDDDADDDDAALTGHDSGVTSTEQAGGGGSGGGSTRRVLALRKVGSPNYLLSKDEACYLSGEDDAHIRIMQGLERYSGKVSFEVTGDVATVSILQPERFGDQGACAGGWTARAWWW
jgi:hypothetical protein